MQRTNVSTSLDLKFIVTLDLHPHSKCIQLQANESLAENFVFRLGELHVFFAMLKVVGKCINGRGINEALVEADIYGPTTMENIKARKHCKRCLKLC